MGLEEQIPYHIRSRGAERVRIMCVFAMITIIVLHHSTHFEDKALHIRYANKLKEISHWAIHATCLFFIYALIINTNESRNTLYKFHHAVNSWNIGAAIVYFVILRDTMHGPLNPAQQLTEDIIHTVPIMCTFSELFMLKDYNWESKVQGFLFPLKLAILYQIFNFCLYYF